jgi:hypothetical protein
MLSRELRDPLAVAQTGHPPLGLGVVPLAAVLGDDVVEHLAEDRVRPVCLRRPDVMRGSKAKGSTFPQRYERK